MEVGVAILLPIGTERLPFGIPLPSFNLPNMVTGATADPVAVCLARRYYIAKNTVPFIERDLVVPTEAEAITELEVPTKWFPARENGQIKAT